MAILAAADAKELGIAASGGLHAAVGLAGEGYLDLVESTQAPLFSLPLALRGWSTRRWCCGTLRGTTVLSTLSMLEDCTGLECSWTLTGMAGPPQTARITLRTRKILSRSSAVRVDAALAKHGRRVLFRHSLT